MYDQGKQDYFDSIAHLWDSWEEMDELQLRLREGLLSLGLTAKERVLDLGCGTGNLTRVLLQLLSPQGQVVAVDFSKKMLQVAREKVFDPRLTWLQAPATDIPWEAESIDRVICFSTWPHFSEPAAVGRELYRLLREGGWFHIWHNAGKDKINEIHTRVGGVIGGDLLVPAADLAQLLQEECGFQMVERVDTESHYLLSARKQ